MHRAAYNKLNMEQADKLGRVYQQRPSNRVQKADELLRNIQMTECKNFLLQLGLSQYCANQLAMESLQRPEFDLLQLQQRWNRVKQLMGPERQSEADTIVLREIQHLMQEQKKNNHQQRARTPSPRREWINSTPTSDNGRDNIDEDPRNNEKQPPKGQQANIWGKDLFNPQIREESTYNIHEDPRDLTEESQQPGNRYDHENWDRNPQQQQQEEFNNNWNRKPQQQEEFNKIWNRDHYLQQEEFNSCNRYPQQQDDFNNNWNRSPQQDDFNNNWNRFPQQQGFNKFGDHCPQQEGFNNNWNHGPQQEEFNNNWNYRQQEGFNNNWNRCPQQEEFNNNWNYRQQEGFNNNWSRCPQEEEFNNNWNYRQQEGFNNNWNRCPQQEEFNNNWNYRQQAGFNNNCIYRQQVHFQRPMNNDRENYNASSRDAFENYPVQNNYFNDQWDQPLNSNYQEDSGNETGISNRHSNDRNNRNYNSHPHDQRQQQFQPNDNGRYKRGNGNNTRPDYPQTPKRRCAEEQPEEKEFRIHEFTMPYIKLRTDPLPQPENDSYAISFYQRKRTFLAGGMMAVSKNRENLGSETPDSNDVDEINPHRQAYKRFRRKLRSDWEHVYASQEYSKWELWWRGYKWCEVAIENELKRYENVNFNELSFVQHRIRYDNYSTAIDKLMSMLDTAFSDNNDFYAAMSAICELMNLQLLTKLKSSEMGQIQDRIRYVPNALWVYKMKAFVYLWARYSSIQCFVDPTIPSEDKEVLATQVQWNRPTFHWMAREAFHELTRISAIEWPEHKKTIGRIVH